MIFKNTNPDSDLWDLGDGPEVWEAPLNPSCMVECKQLFIARVMIRISKKKTFEKLKGKYDPVYKVNMDIIGERFFLEQNKEIQIPT